MIKEPLPVDCIYLSKNWACDEIKYASDKPAFKYRCPKTVNADAVCKKQCPKNKGATL